ncbi:MAG: hydroxyethylthiazole kinase, partial [Desulfobacterales bacterium]
MENLAEQAARNLRAVRERKPLVHNITNFVVMNYTANALLAIGASPVMAHAIREVEEMVAHAGALVLNIGTLSEEWVASMITAGRKATAEKIPIVLDPVGAGATGLRTQSARSILSQTRVTVLRGNASEILSLQGQDARTKGVDTTHGVDETAGSAGDLAAELGCTIAVTGALDLVTDGRRVVRVANG